MAAAPIRGLSAEAPECAVGGLGLSGGRPHTAGMGAPTKSKLEANGGISPQSRGLGPGHRRGDVADRHWSRPAPIKAEGARPAAETTASAAGPGP